jgi:hypothetical protein
MTPPATNLTFIFKDLFRKYENLEMTSTWFRIEITNCNQFFDRPHSDR